MNQLFNVIICVGFPHTTFELILLTITQLGLGTWIGMGSYFFKGRQELSVIEILLIVTQNRVKRSETLTVCLVGGWVGWVGSNPVFGDGANPSSVWLHL